MDTEKAQRWDSRGHFFAAAAEAMRRILVDRARRKQRPKHGGGRQRLDLDSAFPASDATPDAVLAIDEALGKLEREFPEKAALIKLRYYAGCSLGQAADAMGIPRNYKKTFDLRSDASVQRVDGVGIAVLLSRFFSECMSCRPEKLALSY